MASPSGIGTSSRWSDSRSNSAAGNAARRWFCVGLCGVGIESSSGVPIPTLRYPINSAGRDVGAMVSRGKELLRVVRALAYIGDGLLETLRHRGQYGNNQRGI